MESKQFPQIFTKNLDLSNDEEVKDEHKMEVEYYWEYSMQSYMRDIFSHDKNKSHYFKAQKICYLKII